MLVAVLCTSGNTLEGEQDNILDMFSMRCF